MNTHRYDLSIRVLISKEDGQFVAHALDMDILAYGSTEQEAKAELERLLDDQLGFAASAGKPEMIHFPAPKDFFDRWEKAHAAQLRGQSAPEKSAKLYSKAMIIAFTGEELQRLRRSRQKSFTRQNKLALA